MRTPQDRIAQLDALLSALGDVGFSLPHMARVRDYPGDPAGLRNADHEAWAQNRSALEAALQRSGYDEAGS